LINTDPGPILEFLRVGSGALHLKFLKSWVWLTHTCNPSTRKTEAWGSQVQGQTRLHSKFQASLSNLAGPFLKKQNSSSDSDKLHLDLRAIRKQVFGIHESFH
jgi:hypothetical protein